MEYQPLIEKFKNEHILRGSSPRTIQAYTTNCVTMFNHLGKHPWDIDEEHLKQYIHYLIKKGDQAKTCNQKIYSIKSFYKLVSQEGKEDPSKNLPRQKEPQKVINIISQEEVEKLICSLSNLKHKAILVVAYSTGLRLEETRLLKITDIDSNRMVIHVHRGKGNKDRLVPLFQETLEFLRKYYKCYRPKKYLFEGRVIEKPLCRRSLHALIKRAVKLAGIKKKVSMHTLRHCFATQILGTGTPIQTIQLVLGHRDIRTTCKYTHVTDEMILKVKSPLDLLNKKSAPKKKGGHNE